VNKSTQATRGRQVQFKVNVPQILHTSGMPQGFIHNRDNGFIYDDFGGSDVELIISSTFSFWSNLINFIFTLNGPHCSSLIS
jgi:hypothetical protein